MLVRLLSVGIVVLGVSLSSASDVAVKYAVQEKPLKVSSIVGTPLTFTLYSDSACTSQVFQAVVPIENVTLISRLKRLTPKGGVKGPTTDEIQTTLSGVEPPAQTYLKVTGAGVTASGGDCQLQASPKTSGPVAIWKDANGKTMGPAVIDQGTPMVGMEASGGLVRVGISIDGSQFLPAFSCVYFATNDCSGPGGIRDSGVLTEGVVLGSTLYYPSGTSSAVSIQSYNCNTGCNAAGGSVSTVPASTLAISFAPPFHLAVQ